MKLVAQSVGSINVDQRVVENPSVEDKNEISTYKVRNTNENVSVYEEVEGNTFSPALNRNGLQACKTSKKVNSHEQVQTPSVIYNTKGRISSKGLYIFYDGIRNLQSKGSDLHSSSDEIK